MPLNFTRLFFLAILMWLPYPSFADDPRDQVEAAYLYRMANYIEWPEATFPKIDSPIVIGFYGQSGLRTQATRLFYGREIKGRPVIVKTVENLDRLDGVHLVYVNAKAWTDAHQALTHKSGAGIVTISREASDDFLPIINFVADQNRIKFDINNSQARDIGIKFDADLLTVAREIY